MTVNDHLSITSTTEYKKSNIKNPQIEHKNNSILKDDTRCDTIINIKVNKIISTLSFNQNNQIALLN